MKRFLSCSLIFIGCLPLQAQLIHMPGKGTSDAQKKDKEKEKDTKNQHNYEKLRDYSENKYRSDPDFKDQVDQQYEELMRTHSQRAYDKNISRVSYMRSVHEDNWREHVSLYDNLLVQNHVNRIGQRLVPEGSETLYAFKVVADPIPSAEALATGTVYVSTGMISILDNEAQLAYVLAHEMAHVYKDHWKERVMMSEGSEEYAKEQSKKVERLALFGTLAGAGLGSAIGGAAGNALKGAELGAVSGASVGLIAGLLLNRPLLVNWNKAEEDDADDIAFKQVMAANYDVREVPKLYIAMEKAVVRDSRVGLGFLGNRKRVTQRREHAQSLIDNAFKADLEAKLKGGDMQGTSAEHRNLMAELKRDNGIMAYYHDMFALAQRNLEEATSIRTNDPAAHYFYGKTLELVGRNADDAKKADSAFLTAAQYDFRNQNYGSTLHHAMSRMSGGAPSEADKQTIRKELDEYVTNYAKWNIENAQLRMFPPNLDTIYEYMRLYGDMNWRPQPPNIDKIPNYTQYYNLPNVSAALDANRPGKAPEPGEGNAPAAADPVSAAKKAVQSVKPGATRAVPAIIKK